MICLGQAVESEFYFWMLKKFELGSDIIEIKLQKN